MFEVLGAAVAAGTVSPSQMQGMRLQAGSTCYEIIAENKPIGTTLQTLTRSQDGPRPTWDIVIHQKATDPRFGRFDMRDHFVVDRRTLLPIRMDSRRGEEGVDRGWHRIELTYGDSAIHGVKRTSSGSAPVDVPFNGLVWEGNLWGVMIAALPLRVGGIFSVPFWQYDKGFGVISVRVVGRDRATTPSGRVSAWIVEAGTGPGPASRYVIRKGRRQELGYDRGGVGQRPGTSCE